MVLVSFSFFSCPAWPRGISDLVPFWLFPWPGSCPRGTLPHARVSPNFHTSERFGTAALAEDRNGGGSEGLLERLGASWRRLGPDVRSERGLYGGIQSLIASLIDF